MTATTDIPHGAGVRPPSWPFVLSLLAITASVLLAAFPLEDPLRTNGAGWLCGALLPVLMLIFYRVRDRALRMRADYTLTRHGSTRMMVLAGIGVLVGGYHGYFVALWLAS